jgi:hypothetical protein
MDAYDTRLHEAHCAHTYGADYVVVDTPEGGVLYLTYFGWLFRKWLDPARWFPRQSGASEWVPLLGGTGTVYRVTIPKPLRPLLTVVKYSRLGQDVPLYIAAHFPDPGALERASSAAFNHPFEEFGLLATLRGKHARSAPLLTKRPLAIYSPPERFPLWKLGRAELRIDAIQAALDRDQDLSRGAVRIALDPARDYLTVFQWVEGFDAEEALRRGLLSREEVEALTVLVVQRLARAGFRVFDNKPRHYILRTRPDGTLLRDHQGTLCWALIDFELLAPLA